MKSTYFHFISALALVLACAIPAWGQITVGGDAGEVAPADPATWTSGTTVYIGQNSGKTGTLTMDGGSKSVSYSSYLGYNPSSSGTATVTGDGSAWTNNRFYVGNSGTGVLTIADGGKVSSYYGYLGYEAGSSGTVTVTGPGSTWINDLEDFDVGVFGIGILTIADGGNVSTNSGPCWIGYRSGSTGTVIVTGAGSTLISYSMSVGQYGAGTITVENSGNVTADFGSIGSSGTAIVTGAGSIGSISHLYVDGTLIVKNGGKVYNGWGYLGSDSGSTGTAIVTGAGSTWAGLELYVGSGGTAGTLTVADGGNVRRGDLSIDSQSSVNLRVSGNGMLLLGQGGINGSLSNSGKINLLADAFLAAGTYSPIISSSTDCKILWSGAGTYNGTGGTWDDTAKTFTVETATELAAGGLDSVSTGERLLFRDSASDKRMGASFGTVGTGINFSAAVSSTTELGGLVAALADGESVRSAWDLTTNFTGGSALLAFDIGKGRSNVDVWHYDGTAWTPFAASDLIYDGNGIASFTVSDFGGYAVTAVPEPATMGLLALGGLAMIRRRRGR